MNPHTLFLKYSFKRAYPSGSPALKLIFTLTYRNKSTKFSKKFVEYLYHLHAYFRLVVIKTHLLWLYAVSNAVKPRDRDLATDCKVISLVNRNSRGHFMVLAVGTTISEAK